MSSILLLLFLLLPVTGSQRVNSAESLLGRLGTKTPYDERPRKEEHADPETCFHTDSQCSALHIYKVVRHGSRFPTEKHIKKMRKVAQLFGWEISFNIHDAGLLTKTGERELLEIGQRTRHRFEELFQEPYHPLRYDFRSSQVTRALQSASAFAHGMFEGSNVAIPSETKSLDNLLRFHKACPAYLAKVKKNHTLKETGEAMQIEQRIHELVFDSLLLSLKELSEDEVLQRVKTADKSSVVTNVWDICMMEHSVLNRVSRYCNLLTTRDVSLLEYLDDVKTYWNKGYGFPINFEMSCLLFQDIIESTLNAHESYKSKDERQMKRLGTFRFGHAETVIPLIARFGLFSEGKEIYSSGINLDSDEIQNRKWRSGGVVPFAANVALVLYTCGDDEMMIQVLHNEHPIHLPESLCPTTEFSTLCPFQHFIDKISHIMECDFKELCHSQEEL